MPIASDRTAGPLVGSSPPHTPHFDNSALISLLPMPRALAFRLAIEQHDRGIAASPYCIKILKWEEDGFLLFKSRPPITDNFPEAAPRRML
jgi:hypothetical protein